MITTYKAVKKYHNGKIRGIARSIALDSLFVKDVIVNNDYLLDIPRIQFLYIHHVFKDEVDNFDLLLKYLSKKHTFISHSEAVERLLTGNVDKPYISWSSDDGIHNNILAAEVLNRYGASCCFFLNPYSIGLKEEVKLKAFCNKKLKLPEVSFLDWNDVSQLQKQGHEIGAHTYSHDRVSDLTLEEFEDDFRKTDEELYAKCGRIKHFAYTYGKFNDFNKKAYDVVFSNGYESCSSATRGCHISKGDVLNKNELLIRRDQIIAGWPLHQIKYFIKASAKKLTLDTNYLPNSYK
ncbi:polysaccharide deacetylase family protein [uncultured Maribacter sp.]|uniref:polysaccharide deacetylase family protein n=1 Tax=uncultured Maribacter sp. TaxID=431308 RepID=UPI00263393A0|nr:polysaccharide deacetylase family protein [uncultured Maribacter sp.]